MSTMFFHSSQSTLLGFILCFTRNGHSLSLWLTMTPNKLHSKKKQNYRINIGRKSGVAEVSTENTIIAFEWMEICCFSISGG